MVPEGAALFRVENLFAAGIRNIFDRETGRCPLRKARGGLSEKHYVARAVFSGSVENRGIHHRVSAGGGDVRHLPGKTVGGLFLSGRLIP